MDIKKLERNSFLPKLNDISLTEVTNFSTNTYWGVRSGSVCLNSLLGPDKWMTAFVMLPAGLPTAY